MNRHMFELARQESYKATYKGLSSVRVGCIVVYHGTVLARGSNSNKSHTVQKKYNYLRYDDSHLPHYFNPSLHAEVQALNKIKYLDIDFARVEVYTYRETRDGVMALARPCVSCMQFIKELGIRNIYYSTPDGFSHERIVKK